MYFRSVVRFFIPGLIVLATVASFAAAGSSRADQDEGLEASMKKIKRTMKVLEEIAADPAKRADALAAAQELQAAALAAKSATPRNAKRIEDAAAKATFVDGFRKAQCAFLKTAVDLEIAILEGNSEQVKSVLEALEHQEDEGHSKYKKRQ